MGGDAALVIVVVISVNGLGLNEGLCGMAQGGRVRQKFVTRLPRKERVPAALLQHGRHSLRMAGVANEQQRLVGQG